MRSMNAFVCAAALALPALAQAAGLVPATFADTAKAIKPSVVNISTEKKVVFGRLPGGLKRQGQRLDDFFEYFFDGVPREQDQSSLGSGVIMDAGRGLVLTNDHVVDGADRIRVRLHDGREFDAEMVGADPKTDLAVVRIKDGKNLAAAQWGDSNALEVGDWVVAVGSPFGLEQTVSQGIVSAKGRVIGAGPYDDFLQTDAAINPGNSGGPLVNLKAEVVGINTAITTRSGGSEGIGFAIPVAMARPVYEELAANGKVTRGYLGVNIQELTPQLARHFGLPEGRKGVLVAEVMEGGPASKAGMKSGDIVLSVNGQEAASAKALQRMVAASPVGKNAALKVWRDRGEKSLAVKLGKMDDKMPGVRGADEGDEGQAGPAQGVKLGLTVQPLTAESRASLGVKEEWGVLVAQVEAGSAADKAGIRQGDVLLELDKARVASPEELRRLVGKLKPGSEVVARVHREGAGLYIGLTVPEK